VAKRNNEQNALWHCHCRTIAQWLCDGGVPVSEAMIKELLKMTQGNTVDVLGTRVAVPTSLYKMSEHELTPKDIQNDFISFDQLIEKTVVYAATDLNLVLVSPNEKDMVNNA